jgi:hypothetical protein
MRSVITAAYGGHMTTAADPFGGATDAAPDEAYDPFGDSQPESVKGGGGGNTYPYVSYEELNHHLVILQPTSYIPDAPKREEFGGGVQERFTCRLVVLAGEPIEVPERRKNETSGEWEDTGQVIVLGAGGNPWPIEWESTHVFQGKIIGQLKDKFDVRAGQPVNGGMWVGRIRRFPSKQTPKNLVTSDQIDAAIVVYYKLAAAGRNPGAKINFAWGLSNFTSEDKALALAWYSEFRKRTVS